MDLPSSVLPGPCRTPRAPGPLLEAADPCPDLAELAAVYYSMHWCLYFNKMLKCLGKLGELIRKRKSGFIECLPGFNGPKVEVVDSHT